MIPQGIDGVISAYYKVVVKNSHILPTGQWYGPSAVNHSAYSAYSANPAENPPRPAWRHQGGRNLDNYLPMQIYTNKRDVNS